MLDFSNVPSVQNTFAKSQLYLFEIEFNTNKMNAVDLMAGE